MDWKKYNNISHQLKEILKAFVTARFIHSSPASIKTSEVRLLKYFNETHWGQSFPWDNNSIIKILTELSGSNENTIYAFKNFYKFGYVSSINGFYQPILGHFEMFNLQGKISPYKTVLLNEINKLNEHEVFQLNEHFKTPYANNEAPFYTIYLPMAKKRGHSAIEKRPRRITNNLGEKIKLLIEHNFKIINEDANIKEHPLFLNIEKKSNDENSWFLGTDTIMQIITKSFEKILGFKISSTALRHNLGQALADQGASAEVIAEILGHNSLVPGRAYVKATPNIATLKTKALGLNKTYNKIMGMLLTGKIVKRDDVEKEKWVKELVGLQYIGNIGGCGLPHSTPCPKNPIYACYTCKKFQPFKDGKHTQVAEQLRKQAKQFWELNLIIINKELNDFIQEEKMFFLEKSTGINWNDDKWNTQNWLYHRSTDYTISFKTLSPAQIKMKPENILFSPTVIALPQPFLDFT